MVTRPIPSSGETIPVIGMGTWVTFNIGHNQKIRLARCQVLDTFFRMGGVMVDSSPMYGSSEEVVGHCMSNLQPPEPVFATTKVWTSSTDEGRIQIQNSFDLWRINTFGLSVRRSWAGRWGLSTASLPRT